MNSQESMGNEDAYSEAFDAPAQESSLTNLNKNKMNIQITSSPVIRSPTPLHRSNFKMPNEI